MPVAPLDHIRSRIGEEVGTSGWLAMDQARITAFVRPRDLDPALAPAMDDD